MGFEDQIDWEQSHELMKPWMHEAYEKATKLSEDSAVDPERFTDLYGKENVENDLAEVERLKERFETDDTKKAADILEGIIYQHGELSDWFGPTAETIKTSEYDDIKNGCDLVLEFTEDDRAASHLALAVDVTFGNNIVKEKLERIKKEIDADTLRDIKYFESENHSFRGSLQKVPRVVIGVETETVSELSAAWVRGDNTYIGKSQAQYTLLEEMKIQLETFTEYAEREGHEDVARQYRRALKTLRNILETKDIPNEETAWQEDRVLRGIDRGLSGLFRETNKTA